jgi:hypothetical protein
MGRGRWHGRQVAGAEGAAAGGFGDFAEAFRTLAGNLGDRFFGLAHRHQLVHRHDYKEVDDNGNDQRAFGNKA